MCSSIFRLSGEGWLLSNLNEGAKVSYEVVKLTAARKVGGKPSRRLTSSKEIEAGRFTLAARAAGYMIRTCPT